MSIPSDYVFRQFDFFFHEFGLPRTTSFYGLLWHYVLDFPHFTAP